MVCLFLCMDMNDINDHSYKKNIMYIIYIYVYVYMYIKYKNET